MKLLVTGTSGFIGTSFCERLSGNRAFDVVGLDRRPPRETFATVEHISADLTDRAAVVETFRRLEPDVIVHLAAQARVDPSLVVASPTYSDNVVATLNLIAGAEKLGRRAPTFVYASSETVYGAASVYPSPESVALNPLSPYAASKAASELLVTRAFPSKSLILRSGMGYGPRSDPSAQVVGRFITRALAGKPLLFPVGMPASAHPTRDVNYVENFLDGVELGLRAGATGTFNVASGRELSVLDLAKFVVRAVGRGEVVMTDQFHYRPGETGGRTWLDISKAHDSFGYAPRVGLDAGLHRATRWYASNPTYFEPTPTIPVSLPR
jgi:nucleoside-diphosphate-sugar epimerase